ncbi:M90 family metallopeptidase [Tautonia plasticadhaerens]|uniref:Protein MtfA n=1 Tax=Tautonia plasticadhaerens TaxID=2527974 RepID=A0A518H9T3_9BACT|nr:M90 family metallopeptidase [Tautonia plasticadhaerens]QDV37610.1 Protein MtfA [Tautonia plasticadhaerens]
MFGLFESRSRRRDRLRAEPFPEAWEAILRKNVPLDSRLPEEDRRELRGLIRVFLDEKRFEGCAGLEPTDEIRVTIAAQACVLLLHREVEAYHRLVTILVYPSAYVAHARQPIGGGMVLEGEVSRLGEAWRDGVVVLAWDDVLAGALDLHDGHNVVLHEFAHQLDQEDGEANGAPILGQRSRYVTWARVLGAEYDRLRQEAGRGVPSVLDAYGATNPAEFFAVATECFFERPARLRREHPELFEELKGYYRQDPDRFLGTEPRPAAR